jgi:hypothetical protein
MQYHITGHVPDFGIWVRVKVIKKADQFLNGGLGAFCLGGGQAV